MLESIERITSLSAKRDMQTSATLPSANAETRYRVMFLSVGQSPRADIIDEMLASLDMLEQLVDTMMFGTLIKEQSARGYVRTAFDDFVDAYTATGEVPPPAALASGAATSTGADSPVAAELDTARWTRAAEAVTDDAAEAAGS